MRFGRGHAKAIDGIGSMSSLASVKLRACFHAMNADTRFIIDRRS